MNAADHGGDPNKVRPFSLDIQPGSYRVEVGRYGWEPDDPVLLLWRLVSP